MLHQAARGSEAFFAEITGIWSTTCAAQLWPVLPVHPEVDGERITLCEFYVYGYSPVWMHTWDFKTEFVRNLSSQCGQEMWPLSTVTQKMNFMWGVAIKSFITKMASNGRDSRIGVNKNMIIKVFMLPIGLVAIRTFQWLNWRVSQMLVSQSGKLLDSHWSLLWREHGEDSVWCEGEVAWGKKKLILMKRWKFMHRLLTLC